MRRTLAALALAALAVGAGTACDEFVAQTTGGATYHFDAGNYSGAYLSITCGDGSMVHGTTVPGSTGGNSTAFCGTAKGGWNQSAPWRTTRF